MKIVSLSPQQFHDFVSSHPLNNYMQTHKYALVMADYDYTYDFIGYENNGEIVAATMILSKVIIGKTKYGYAPKGFLINYYDELTLKAFLKDLKEYYLSQDYIFIKFNPEIIIGSTTKDQKYTMSYNGNVRLIDILKDNGVKRRLELKEFDLIEPKFLAYIDLKKFDIKNIDRNFRKKIRKCLGSGMSLVTGDVREMDKLYPFLKTKRPIIYYRTFYNSFDKDKSIDLLFIKIDFEKRLTHIREKYEKEQLLNDELNNIIQKDPSQGNLIKKMSSDRRLDVLKDVILRATEDLKKHKEAIVGGALVIKHFNRVTILASGFDRNYKGLNPNHFLHYAIIERYKPYFNYLDIGGVTGKFEGETKYKGLDEFKLKWNPIIFEMIGEFDLICSDKTFKRLIKTSFIEDEFNKHLDHE
ncbi:MAG: aminoacyltransferase [Bacilli bacterium]|nr:aminoacyltransferase [Bacilli bacterium]